MRFPKLIAGIFLGFLVCSANAQQVENTSYTTASGEKVLKLEMVVPINRMAAWDYFTKDDLLKKWIAPLAHIDLKTGGFILTNYDKEKSLEDSSSIRLVIINYLEGELLTLKVKLNDNFPKSVQNEDGNLQELIQFKDEGNGKTRIISSMIGWGNGDDWNKTYNLFVKGNTWTYEELYKAIQAK
ncbi:MAG: hypothetical protein ABI683_03390 [Ginsengibacter sp.]